MKPRIPSTLCRSLLTVTRHPRSTTGVSPSRHVKTGLAQPTRHLHLQDIRSPTPPDLPPPSLPSSVATSSKVTLDDFPLFSSTDPIIVSLQYATDAELLRTLLTAPPIPRGSKRPRRPIRHVSPYNLDWSSSVDPGFAFLALRERSTYQQLLDHIAPQLEKIYNVLKWSGMHQLLASDLLLLHPDPRILRLLLEIHVRSGSDRPLRSSMIVSIYARLRPLINAGRVGSLSEGVCKLVIENLGNGDDDLLRLIWEDLLEATIPQDPPWQLFDIPLSIAKQGHLDEALDMVQKMADTGHVPIRIGRIDPSLSNDKKRLAISSICLRSALQLQYYTQSQSIASDLLEYLTKLPLSLSMFNLLLESCRVALVSGHANELEWAEGSLSRLINLPHAPPLPSSALNNYLESTTPQKGRQFYMSLPEQHHPPSPENIIRLASTKPDARLLVSLLKDINQLGDHEFIGQRSAFILYLVLARHRNAVMALYPSWSHSFVLSSGLMLAMVKLFVTTNKKQDYSFAQNVLDHFRAKHTPSFSNSIAIVRGHIALKDWEAVQATLKALRPVESRITITIKRLLRRLPREGITLFREAHRAGLAVGHPIDMIATACLAGQWAILNSARTLVDEHDLGDTIRFLRALEMGDLRSAKRHLDMLIASGAQLPTSAYRVFLHTALGVPNWQTALDFCHGVPEDETDLRRTLSWILCKRVYVDLRADQRSAEGLREMLASECWQDLEKWMLKHMPLRDGTRHGRMSELIDKINQLRGGGT